MLSESRLTAWQSSDGIPFAYSGKVMEPAPFSPSVLRLRDALYERTGVLYDGVLLNLYESRCVFETKGKTKTGTNRNMCAFFSVFV